MATKEVKEVKEEIVEEVETDTRKPVKKTAAPKKPKKPARTGTDEEEETNTRKPWSTKKKVGIGGAILAAVAGLGYLIFHKKKDNDDSGYDDESDE